MERKATEKESYSTCGLSEVSARLARSRRSCDVVDARHIAVHVELTDSTVLPNTVIAIPVVGSKG